MPSIEHQLIEIYVFADDYLKQHPHLARWRTSNHGAPEFTDAEVLTLGLAQGCFGVQSLKESWRKVADNYRHLFPHLPTYQQWLARLQALGRLIGALLEASTALPEAAERFYLIDAKPIPLCQPLRHGRVRLLREEGAYFGKTSRGWFFGFQLHLLRHCGGRILNAVLLPANWDEHDAELLLAEATAGGVVLGDLGYRGEASRDRLLEEADLLLLTRADAPERKRLLSQIRQAIETCFSQLWYKFIDRVFSRSWHGLWNTVRLKLLFYNLCHAGVVSL